MREQDPIQRAWYLAVKPVNSTGLHSSIGFWWREGREKSGGSWKRKHCSAAFSQCTVEKGGTFVVAAIPTESKTKP